ncbi:MAG: nitroreductase [Pseudomonadota bacterium]
MDDHRNSEAFDKMIPAEGEPVATAPGAATTLMFLARRRSLVVRELTGPGPSAAERDLLLRVGLRVPDHGKLEPWRVVVIEGAARDRLGTVAASAFAKREPDANPPTLAAEAGRFARAPLVLAVVAAPVPSAKVPEWEQTLSAGALCHQLLLAANALGFAAQWLTEWVAYDRDVMAAIGCGADERIAGFVYVGRGAAETPERRRPTVAERVRYL